MDDSTLREKFEQATVTESEWRHEEHIRIAYLYLSESDPEAAYQKLKHHLQKLNAAHQVPDEPHRGYHETLTRAWLLLVESELGNFQGTSLEFVAAHPQLLNKNALRFFYSRDRLMDPEAKKAFLKPDRRPLP